MQYVVNMIYCVGIFVTVAQVPFKVWFSAPLFGGEKKLLMEKATKELLFADVCMYILMFHHQEIANTLQNSSTEIPVPINSEDCFQPTISYSTVCIFTQTYHVFLTCDLLLTSFSSLKLLLLEKFGKKMFLLISAAA